MKNLRKLLLIGAMAAAITLLINAPQAAAATNKAMKNKAVATISASIALDATNNLMMTAPAASQTQFNDQVAMFDKSIKKTAGNTQATFSNLNAQAPDDVGAVAKNNEAAAKTQANYTAKKNLAAQLRC